MGTRSNVIIRENGTTLTCLYRQYDGYPSGMGQDILDALNGGDVALRNGYQIGDVAPEAFNGMGCLAAYLVGALKGDQIGNVYLYPPDHTPGSAMEEYVYTLDSENGLVTLKVVDVHSGAALYQGTLKGFDPELAEAP